MRTAVTSAVIAAVVSIVAVLLFEMRATEDSARGAAAVGAAAVAEPVPLGSPALSLSYTDELPEDVWVNGRQPGGDRRSLADASHSVCYITKLEIKGVQAADDANSCVIAIDDFTGFWELIASVESGQSEVRCNARCLVWE